MNKTDPGRVRLISRHFNDLCGFRTAVIGILLMGASGTWLATRNRRATVLAWLGLFLLAVWLLPRLERYYRDRFGRVEQRDQTHGLFVLFAGIGGSFVSRPESAWVYWAFISSYSLWLLYDGWPYRTQELFVVAACACAAVLTTRNGGEVSLAPGLFLVGLAYVVAGWADHKLLVRSLNRTGNVVSNTEHADTI